MFAKVLPAACLAALLVAAPALAQLKEPAELPPAGFAGQQYVDSKGCVFLRAGYGGKVTWVPRVTRDRRQLCGYAPTDRSAAPSAGAETAVASAGPAPAPAAAPKPAAKSPVKSAAKAASGGAGGTVSLRAGPPPQGVDLQLACPAAMPVAERLPLRGGGTKLMCTTGDGGHAGASLPILVDGRLEGAPVGYAAWQSADAGPAAAPVPAGRTAIAPPPGYKFAWTDGRLNPNRGRQTVAGVYAQDEVWTRSVPAELREDWPKPKAPLKVIVRNRDGSTTVREGVVVSTKSDGRRVVRAVEPAAGPLLVQVGTFGVPANVEGAAGRLRGLGLPVAQRALKGGALTVVYAGPFASGQEAQAALAAARGAGFADAMIVN